MLELVGLTIAGMLQALAAAGIIDSAYKQDAAEMADVWEASALPFFTVVVPQAQAQQQLTQYSSNISFPAPGAVPGSGVTYYALALDDDGRQVDSLAISQRGHCSETTRNLALH